MYEAYFGQNLHTVTYLPKDFFGFVQRVRKEYSHAFVRFVRFKVKLLEGLQGKLLRRDGEYTQEVFIFIRNQVLVGPVWKTIAISTIGSVWNEKIMQFSPLFEKRATDECAFHLCWFDKVNWIGLPHIFICSLKCCEWAVRKTMVAVLMARSNTRSFILLTLLLCFS